MNNRTNLTLWGLVLLFAVLMSIPWLVPHAGAVALVGFLPLLFAEAFPQPPFPARFLRICFPDLPEPG